MDADGYPDESDFQRIRDWPYADLPGLFVFLRERWWSREWGWHEEGRVFHISTGGWSGNESMIAALEVNDMAWRLTWQSSRRGGHYEFEIPERR